MNFNVQLCHVYFSFWILQPYSLIFFNLEDLLHFHFLSFLLSLCVCGGVRGCVRVRSVGVSMCVHACMCVCVLLRSF